MRPLGIATLEDKIVQRAVVEVLNAVDEVDFVDLRRVPAGTQPHDALDALAAGVTRHWCAALRNRSQRHRLTWDRMNRLATRWLPPARILHPYPDMRFDARTRGRSPVR